MRRLTVALLLASLYGCTHPVQPPPTTPDALQHPGAARTVPPPVAPTAPVLPPPKPRPEKVKIQVKSVPPKAKVYWGRKKLGETPLTMVRERDTGPIEIVVRSDGYFPVHTRVFTFRNDKINVRLTKLEDRLTLFGAKHDQPDLPDGGLPSEANGTPLPTAAPAGPAPVAPAPIAPTPVAPPAP